jgi:hypothetical protein
MNDKSLSDAGRAFLGHRARDGAFFWQGQEHRCWR